MQVRKIIAGLVVAGCFAPGVATATNGYFQHGYGLKAKGMAGVGTATAADTFGGANNPAGMVWVGNRVDFGVDLFSPRREASRFGSDPTFIRVDGTADSDSIYFLVPEFGYNRMLNPNLSLGVTVYANGGMNTNYPGGQIPAASACAGFNPTGPYNLLCGNGRLGVDLMQLVIAPTLAYKLTPNHSIGVSPLIGIQRFKVDGLQAFDNPFFSNSPGNVTNRGHEWAHGFGVRVGWFGKLSDSVNVGAAYSTKIYMTEFDKYKGLFAEDGDFDMPENYNVGIAFKVSPKLTIAADYQRINYSEVKSVGNSQVNLGPCFFGGNRASCLGGPSGAGFGWNDVNVFKIGFEYQYNQRWTLRAGYDHTDNPIKGSDIDFNILAPGVVQDHVTFGFTYKTSTNGELTFAYMHAFNHGVTAPTFLNAFVPPGVSAGSASIKMYQNAVGIAYGWRM